MLSQCRRQLLLFSLVIRNRYAGVEFLHLFYTLLGQDDRPTCSVAFDDQNSNLCELRSNKTIIAESWNGKLLTWWVINPRECTSSRRGFKFSSSVCDRLIIDTGAVVSSISSKLQEKTTDFPLFLNTETANSVGWRVIAILESQLSAMLVSFLLLHYCLN